MKRPILIGALVLAAAFSAEAQFLEDFDRTELAIDQSGVEGWSFFSGDGEATIEFVATGDGHASILVDATRDRENIWWALIKHRVSEQMDLARLVRPNWELRVEARIRSSHAPRRVNLHLNTQRTTDFHSHLMEFDIPKAGQWRTISMTTRDFSGGPGDSIFAQMALMDWGTGSYRVDVDYFRVDLVNTDRVGADLGEPIPYHPPVADPKTFGLELKAAESAMVDLSRPAVNIDNEAAGHDAEVFRVLTMGGSNWVILRWDVGSFWGRRVTGSGLLGLTTHSFGPGSGKGEDSGLARVVEILAGDPEWRRGTVTLDNLTRGETVDEVFNPQMIIDWPVAGGLGEKTWFTISRPALQRLIEGRTLGLAIRPLGPIDASFFAGDGKEPTLLFNLQE